MQVMFCNTPQAVQKYVLKVIKLTNYIIYVLHTIFYIKFYLKNALKFIIVHDFIVTITIKISLTKLCISLQSSREFWLHSFLFQQNNVFITRVLTLLWKMTRKRELPACFTLLQTTNEFSTFNISYKLRPYINYNLNIRDIKNNF